MLQVHPLELESQMIICVHHLMRQCILHVPLVPHLVRADHDAVFGRETTSPAARAASAADVILVKVSMQLADLLIHETDDWA